MGDYNGWTNYETWNVKLWIDNEEGSHNYWRENAEKAWKEALRGGNRFAETRLDRARILLAERLKDEHEENAPEVTGVYADLIGAALSEVNWDKIAQAMLEDGEFVEDEEEEEESEETNG